MLIYRAALDLSRSTLNDVAGLVRRRRKVIGSRWRLLNPGQQALPVLAYLRKDETFTEISAGFFHLGSRPRFRALLLDRVAPCTRHMPPTRSTHHEGLMRFAKPAP